VEEGRERRATRPLHDDNVIIIHTGRRKEGEGGRERHQEAARPEGGARSLLGTSRAYCIYVKGQLTARGECANTPKRNPIQNREENYTV